MKNALRIAHGIGKYRQNAFSTPTAGDLRTPLTPQSQPHTNKTRQGTKTY